MGRVHLARHRDTGAVVALKTLALGREFDGFALEARQRFQREALAACRLDHADIVRVFDSGEQDGIAYIAMERLTGQDLSQHLAPGICCRWYRRRSAAASPGRWPMRMRRASSTATSSHPTSWSTSA